MEPGMYYWGIRIKYYLFPAIDKIINEINVKLKWRPPPPEHVPSITATMEEAVYVCNGGPALEGVMMAPFYTLATYGDTDENKHGPNTAILFLWIIIPGACSW